MPDNENEVIARWLDGHGHPELAWRNADDAMCANGHIAPKGATPDKRCDVPGCGHRLIVYPYDFTQPTPLLAAVEAYFEHPLASIDWEWYRVKGGWLVYFIDSVRNEDQQWKGVGATPEEALRAALAAAITAEGGNTHD